MPLKIKCTCDICCSDMPVPQYYNDSNNNPNILISEDNKLQIKYTFVCESCLKKINHTIDTIKINSINFNDELRIKCHKAYRDNNNNKITAIKELKNSTDLGLRESRDQIEKWMYEHLW